MTTTDSRAPASGSARTDRRCSLVEATAAAQWMVVAERSTPNDIAELIVPAGQPMAASRTFCDSAVLATKGLIVRDVQ